MHKWNGRPLVPRSAPSLPRWTSALGFRLNPQPADLPYLNLTASLFLSIVLMPSIQP